MNYILSTVEFHKPIETYNESLADDNIYEGKVKWRKSSFPPYN
jgi:hypothetical protein